MFDNIHEDYPEFEPRAAYRVLSVSGGGLLGVIPAAMLLRYEALGKTAYGDGYRLAQSFDLVGGSSTGAVIATGIALGLSASEIADFYLRDVPVGFRRRKYAVPGLHDVLDGDLMQSFFRKRTGGKTLTSAALETDLCITAKDVARNRSLMFTSVGCAAQTRVPGTDIRNDNLPLDLLLRASTAAPGLFSPVALPLDGSGDTFFMDGGLGPYKNPALALHALTRSIGWHSIDMTVLGTGSTRKRPTQSAIAQKPAWFRILHAFSSILNECEDVSDDWMQHLAMAQPDAVSYRKLDMSIDAETFQLLGCSAKKDELRVMRRFADPRGKARLFEVACHYAEMTLFEPLPLAGVNAHQALVDSRAASRPTGGNDNCFKV